MATGTTGPLELTATDKAGQRAHECERLLCWFVKAKCVADLAALNGERF